MGHVGTHPTTPRHNLAAWVTLGGAGLGPLPVTLIVIVRVPWNGDWCRAAVRVPYQRPYKAALLALRKLKKSRTLGVQVFVVNEFWRQHCRGPVLTTALRGYEVNTTRGGLRRIFPSPKLEEV